MDIFRCAKVLNFLSPSTLEWMFFFFTVVLSVLTFKRAAGPTEELSVTIFLFCKLIGGARASQSASKPESFSWAHKRLINDNKWTSASLRNMSCVVLSTLLALRLRSFLGLGTTRSICQFWPQKLGSDSGSTLEMAACHQRRFT